jgi:3-phenylpropionate/cinnamic acid dioxygenase small subunit
VNGSAQRDVPVELWYRVYQLYTDYADLLDERRLEQWLGLFDTGCLYQAISRENMAAGLPLALMRCEGVPGLRDRVNAILNTSVYAPRTMRHVVSGIRVRPVAERVLRVEAAFAVLQTLADDHTRVFAAGCYRDEVRDSGQHLLFVSKKAIYDGALVVNSMVYPL